MQEYKASFQVNNMMKQQNIVITTILVIFLSVSQAKVMRNNALITKMVSNFHQNNDDVETPDKDTESVLIRMQIVLCKNFPTIPCDLITQDQTLKKLIEKSIQQINYKKLSLDNKTTPFPEYLTLFPSLNNDDLSNFIKMSDTNNRHETNKHPKKKITREGNRKVNARAREKKNHDRRKKFIKNKSKATSVYNRKKLRKFYPHKVKYQDKNNRKYKEDFGDNTIEKFSMSVEVPDMPITRKHQHLAYKVEPDNPPVWRIDYTKHGEPSVNNLFDFDLADRFNRKIIKTGPSVVVDGNEQTRKDVLHPDLFITNNFVKTNDANSDGVD